MEIVLYLCGDVIRIGERSRLLRWRPQLIYRLLRSREFEQLLLYECTNISIRVHQNAFCYLILLLQSSSGTTPVLIPSQGSSGNDDPTLPVMHVHEKYLVRIIIAD